MTFYKNYKSNEIAFGLYDIGLAKMLVKFFHKSLWKTQMKLLVIIIV